jgi:hypothetical protein
MFIKHFVSTDCSFICHRFFNLIRTKHARSIYRRSFFQNAKFRQNKLNNYMLHKNYLKTKKSPRIWRASKIEAFNFHLCNIRKGNECVSLKYSQQDVKFSRSFYLYKLQYMFQAVFPPIIRSTKLYIQRQVLSKQYYCYCGWDGREFRLIHDSSSQQYWFDNTWRCIYNFVLLMMGGGTAWNM